LPQFPLLQHLLHFRNIHLSMSPLTQFLDHRGPGLCAEVVNLFLRESRSPTYFPFKWPQFSQRTNNRPLVRPNIEPCLLL
jgi:hypothetical protein